MSDLAALSNMDPSSAVSVAVARESLDAAKAEGDSMVALIRAAGSMAPSSTGRPAPGEPGGRIDVAA
jgi:hypothetical protein